MIFLRWHATILLLDCHKIIKFASAVFDIFLPPSNFSFSLFLSCDTGGLLVLLLLLYCGLCQQRAHTQKAQIWTSSFVNGIFAIGPHEITLPKSVTVNSLPEHLCYPEFEGHDHLITQNILSLCPRSLTFWALARPLVSQGKAFNLRI